MPPLDGPFREALVQIPKRVCVASLEVFVNRVVALAAPIADHRDRHSYALRRQLLQLDDREDLRQELAVREVRRRCNRLDRYHPRRQKTDVAFLMLPVSPIAPSSL